MKPEIEIESVHEDEGYVPPDVERLGTAEALTGGTSNSGFGDATSLIT